MNSLDTTYSTSVIISLIANWLSFPGHHFQAVYEDLTLLSGSVVSICTSMNFFTGADVLYRQHVYTYDNKGNCTAGQCYDYDFVNS